LNVQAFGTAIIFILILIVLQIHIRPVIISIILLIEWSNLLQFVSVTLVLVVLAYNISTYVFRWLNTRSLFNIWSPTIVARYMISSFLIRINMVLITTSLWKLLIIKALIMTIWLIAIWSWRILVPVAPTTILILFVIMIILIIMMFIMFIMSIMTIFPISVIISSVIFLVSSYHLINKLMIISSIIVFTNLLKFSFSSKFLSHIIELSWLTVYFIRAFNFSMFTRANSTIDLLVSISIWLCWWFTKYFPR